MPRKVFHVVPAGESEWMLMEEGHEQPVMACPTPEDCLAHARSLARQANSGQVIVHDRAGRFQTEYTYSNTPRDAPG